MINLNLPSVASAVVDKAGIVTSPWRQFFTNLIAEAPRPIVFLVIAVALVAICWSIWKALGSRHKAQGPDRAAENVAFGSLTPISVPASLAV